MHHTAQGSIFHQVYIEARRSYCTGMYLLSRTVSGKVSGVFLWTNQIAKLPKRTNTAVPTSMLNFLCGRCKHYVLVGTHPQFRDKLHAVIDKQCVVASQLKTERLSPRF